MFKEKILRLNEKEFNESFDFEDVTNVSELGGLLVAAQLYARKGYEITLLENAKHPSHGILHNDSITPKDSEVTAYLKILKQHLSYDALPIKERFILTGAHWVAGYIEITEMKEIKLFFPDNLTTLSSHPQADMMLFLEHIFPDHDCSVYLGYEQRQFTVAGCQSYALDDAQHLFTVGKYLPKNYNANLFQYLENNGVSQGKVNRFHVFKSSIPLHLMRTKTSRNLLQDIDSRPEENSIAINKKSSTAIQEYNNDFVGVVSKKNNRLKKKRAQMKVHNEAYIHSKESKQLESDINRHTFEGFQKRFIKVNTSFKSNENLHFPQTALPIITPNIEISQTNHLLSIDNLASMYSSTLKNESHTVQSTATALVANTDAELTTKESNLVPHTFNIPEAIGISVTEEPAPKKISEDLNISPSTKMDKVTFLQVTGCAFISTISSGAGISGAITVGFATYGAIASAATGGAAGALGSLGAVATGFAGTLLAAAGVHGAAAFFAGLGAIGGAAVATGGLIIALAVAVAVVSAVSYLAYKCYNSRHNEQSEHSMPVDRDSAAYNTSCAILPTKKQGTLGITSSTNEMKV